MKFLDFAGRNRTADDAAGYQSVGRRRDSHCRRSGYAHFLEIRPEGSCSSMTADQRNGSHREAEPPVKTEQLRPVTADNVLNGYHDHSENQKSDDTDTALLQHSEGSEIADAAEEGGHKDRLQRGVHSEFKDSERPHNAVRNGKDQAADHRCRDAVPLQHFDVIHQYLSNQQHDRRDGHCLVHVQFDCQHTLPFSLSLIPISLFRFFLSVKDYTPQLQNYAEEVKKLPPLSDNHSAG